MRGTVGVTVPLTGVVRIRWIRKEKGRLVKVAPFSVKLACRRGEAGIKSEDSCVKA